MRKLKTLCLIGLLCALSSNLFAQNDTISEPVRVPIFDVFEEEYVRMGVPRRILNRSFSAIAIQFFGANVMGSDFSDFEDVLGVENTEILNYSTITYNFGVDYFHRGFNAMLQFGVPVFGSVVNNNRSDRDRTINIRTRTTSLGLQVGYRIIDTRHFFIRPDVAFNYYRIRLTNGERRSVYLDDFVNNRDLDIRFHQFTAYSGLTFAWRVPPDKAFRAFYPTRNSPLYLTLSGGYHFRINDSPWIRSVASRIRTNDRINVSYGFSVGFVRVVRSWF